MYVYIYIFIIHIYIYISRHINHFCSKNYFSSFGSSDPGCLRRPGALSALLLGGGVAGLAGARGLGDPRDPRLRRPCLGVEWQHVSSRSKLMWVKECHDDNDDDDDDAG